MMTKWMNEPTATGRPPDWFQKQEMVKMQAMQQQQQQLVMQQAQACQCNAPQQQQPSCCAQHSAARFLQQKFTAATSRASRQGLCGAAAGELSGAEPACDCANGEGSALTGPPDSSVNVAENYF